MPVMGVDPLEPLQKTYRRGALMVKFDIEFPKYLAEEDKKELTEILAEAEGDEEEEEDEDDF